jgi:hypothetical protein
MMKEPVVYEVEVEKQKYQVELQILEKSDQYVQISISVDDLKYPKGFIHYLRILLNIQMVESTSKHRIL